MEILLAVSKCAVSLPRFTKLCIEYLVQSNAKRPVFWKFQSISSEQAICLIGNFAFTAVSLGLDLIGFM